jgi:hypothetical protein
MTCRCDVEFPIMNIRPKGPLVVIQNKVDNSANGSFEEKLMQATK